MYKKDICFDLIEWDEISSYTLVVIVTVLVLIAFIGVIDLLLSNSISPFIMK